jgi:FKBP-type peptidyl-prolyl cis-trans isomerase
MRPGIKLEGETVGLGPVASRGDCVTIQYDLYLNRGEKVDSRQHTFTVGNRDVIAGLEYGVEGMRKGGKRTIRVSPHLAYRDKGVSGKIPPNAVLIFHVELINVKSKK